MEITGAVNTLSIVHGGKKFKRIATIQLDGSETVEWKRNKSNHSVNSETSKNLETEFQISSAGFMSKANRKLAKDIPVSTLIKMNKEVEKLVKRGSPLAAVKHVKGETGWGLRDSKLYVDDFREKFKK